MAYYLLVRYNANGGTIPDNPHYYSSGVTSYSSVTGSSSSYKYFKSTGSTVTGATSSSGTYGTVGNRYTASSTSTQCNLTNVATFGITKAGYHIVNNAEYKTTSGAAHSTTAAVSEEGSSYSTPSGYSNTNPTISKLGGSTSANKTVTIYVNWLGNSYTINYNANGGTGTTASSSHVYETAKTLTSNGFTRTGYTFAGWNTSSIGEGKWESVGSYSHGWESVTLAATALRASGETIYGYWDSTWYQWNGSEFISATAPGSYYSGSSSYSSCNPLPTKSGGSSYLSVGGRTYVLSVRSTYSATEEDYRYRVDLDIWNPAQSFSNGASVTTLQSKPANGSTLILYAQWTPNNYNVLLGDNAADGTGTGLTTLTMTYGLTSNNSVTPPTRFGHTFSGYEDEVGDLIYNSSGHASSSYYWNNVLANGDPTPTDSSSRSYYSNGYGYAYYGGYNYRAYEYKSVYDGDRDGDDWYYTALQRASNTSSSWSTVYSNTSYTYETGAGYISPDSSNQYYNAWNAAWNNRNLSDHGVGELDVTNSSATWKGTNNAIAYAIWTPKVKSFKLDPNGGTYNGTTGTTTKTVTYGTSENSNVGVPTRAGYRFDGWYYSTGSSRQIFDSTGNAINDASNGPWYNASPTSLASGAKYIHYGDYIWGIYANSSAGLHVCLWEGDEWTEKMTDSAITSLGSAFPKGLGNLIVIVATVNQNMYCATRSADADIWSGGISTLLTPLYSYPTFGEIPYSGSSTTLPNKGKIWLYDNSTTPVPTYYAHWTPKIYIKQNGSWVGGSPQINANGTWKSPTSAYVKVNGTWKQIY